MPHIIIEHDPKTKQDIDLGALCRDLHQCLAKQESVKEEAIKTRSIEVDNLIVGTAENNNQMIHIELKLLTGRSDEVKMYMAEALHAVAKKNLGKIECSITVDVSELGVYKKS